MDKINSNKSEFKFENIKDIVALVPIVGAFLIFCGFIYIKTYYNSFHVKIERYIELSEILLGFLNVIGEFAILSMSAWIYYHILIKRFRRENHNDKTPIRFIIIGAYWTVSLFWYWIYNHWQCVISNTSSDFLNFQKPIEAIVFNWVFIALLLATALLPLRFPNKTAFLVTVIIGFLNFSVFWAVHESQRAKELDRITFVDTEQEIFKSNAKFLYIGKTNNYIFFYYPEKDSTTILPISSLRRIDSGKKNKKF